VRANRRTLGLVGWLCLTKSYRLQRRVPTSAMRKSCGFLGPDSLKTPTILTAKPCGATEPTIVNHRDLAAALILQLSLCTRSFSTQGVCWFHDAGIEGDLLRTPEARKTPVATRATPATLRGVTVSPRNATPPSKARIGVSAPKAAVSPAPRICTA
jgi:hypothetical protein